MANVIKHKRGSGSDPVASDLVVGEVAIRTDVGKLFTKTDSGTVSEIAGGGSDIVLNTLSSSSGTGGGSATFNGSAYRFTLSQPPSVSAYQLLVSINGIIQKPVTGTSQPSEGFAVDGNDIILGDAPATGADYFILTFKSLGVSEPADNSVTSAKIVDGAIVNADINASAAIAKSKIETFVNNNADNRVITGSGTANTLEGEANLTFDSSNNGGSLSISGTSEFQLNLKDSNSTGNAAETAIAFRDSGDTILGLVGYNYWGDGNLDITNNTSGQSICFQTGGDNERMRIDSSGRVGIGDTSPDRELVVKNASSNATVKIEASNAHTSQLFFSDTDAEGVAKIAVFHGSGAGQNALNFETGGSSRLLIDSSGRVGIGATSFNDAAEYLLVKNDSTAANISIVASNDAHSSLNLGDEDDFNIQKIKSDHTNNSLQFFTNNVERMRIVSNGETGINIDNPEAYGANGHGYLGLVVQAPTGNYSGITIRSNYAGGGLLSFSDGSGSNAERKNIALQADHPNKRLNVLVDGTGVARFSANGFHPNPADSAAANALDDYEEGTFTPAMNQGINVSSYTDQKGFYVKVGDFVQVSFKINLSGSGSGNHVRFQGLPFTSVNLTGYHSGGIVTYTNIPGLASAGSGTASVWMGGNSALCELYVDGNSSQATGSGGFTNKEIYIVVTYRTA